MRDALHLSTLPSATLSASWDWDMCLRSLRSATSLCARSFNASLCTPVVDPSMYFLLLKKPP
ncbi:hypothetical protein HAX54_025253, partial [Datura stramonium]|nr:hypothetical protein [Datura stramonium]